MPTQPNQNPSQSQNKNQKQNQTQTQQGSSVPRSGSSSGSQNPNVIDKSDKGRDSFEKKQTSGSMDTSDVDDEEQNAF